MKTHEENFSVSAAEIRCDLKLWEKKGCSALVLVCICMEKRSVRMEIYYYVPFRFETKIFFKHLFKSKVKL